MNSVRAQICSLHIRFPNARGAQVCSKANTFPPSSCKAVPTVIVGKDLRVYLKTMDSVHIWNQPVVAVLHQEFQRVKTGTCLIIITAAGGGWISAVLLLYHISPTFTVNPGNLTKTFHRSCYSGYCCLGFMLLLFTFTLG